MQAFDKFLNSKIKRDVFNIGGGVKNTLSLIELLDLIKTQANKKPKLSYADWRPADQKVYISDITKAKKLLNWVPEVSPSEGVKRLIVWCSENKKFFT